MVVKKPVLTLDQEILNKINDKSKKQEYGNPQQYVYELIRRDIFRKKTEERSKVLSSEEEYLNKFSTPTKETRKIQRMIREGRI